jgi:magnesium transporter
MTTDADRNRPDPLPGTYLIRPEILALLESRQWDVIREAVSDWPGAEVADLVLHLRKSDRVLFFRALPRRTGAAAFAHLTPDQRDALLRDLTDDETTQVLENLSPDDRTHLLEELPGQATQRLLNLLSPGDLEETRRLLGYPEDSVGRLMTPDYVAVHAEWTVADALQHIRTHGQDSETVNRIYVIDQDWRLLDDIELRRIILAPPTARVADLMDHAFASVHAAQDREEAVRIIRRYDQVALPAIDSDGVLVGIVTVDDLLDVAEAEATEDFHKVASVGPIRTSLRDAGIAFLYRRRIGWLMVLVFMNIFSGEALAAFEETIAAAVALVFFLPLLIDSGGNAGSQSATLMVRALATGDVRGRDWLRMLGKEIGVALLLGATMALGVAAISLYRAPEILPIVAITMTLIVLWGSTIGMLLPFILTRLGRDPAAASAPLITSIADISGVLIYFSIASWYLGTGA